MSILKKILMSFLIVVPMTAVASPLVNINTANAFEIQDDLIGVTEKTAQKIVEHRNIYGPFKSKEDLVKVEGIEWDFVNLNQDYITFGDTGDTQEHSGN